MIELNDKQRKKEYRGRDVALFSALAISYSGHLLLVSWKVKLPQFVQAPLPSGCVSLLFIQCNNLTKPKRTTRDLKSPKLD